MSEDKHSEDKEMRFDRADLEDHEVQNIHSQVGREKEEPKEGFAFPPLIIVFMCMGLCLWAGFEISHSSGGFKWDVYDPDKKSTGKEVAKVYDPIKAGKRVYNNCIACHQANGMGVPGAFPPLAGSDWMGKSPDILARIVIYGLSGEIVVNGETYNNVMTPLSNLSDKEVAAVLSYTRNAWGNQYSIVTEEEVAAVRAAVGSRSSPYTAAELLEQFPD